MAINHIVITTFSNAFLYIFVFWQIDLHNIICQAHSKRYTPQANPPVASLEMLYLAGESPWSSHRRQTWNHPCLSQSIIEDSNIQNA